MAKLTRSLKTKLNPKSMELEDVTTLTCPRCGKEEKLNARRAKKTHTIEIQVFTNEEARQGWKFDDVCLVCLAEIAEWVTPSD